MENRKTFKAQNSMTKFDREKINKTKAERQRKESFNIIPDNLGKEEAQGPGLNERELRREKKRQRLQQQFENGNMDLRKMIFLGDDDSDYYSNEEEQSEEDISSEVKPEPKEDIKSKEDTDHLPSSVDNESDEMTDDLDTNLRKIRERK